MTFVHHRVVRFQDTDAAGVVFFANVLGMCHEAYEASLAEVGIDLRSFFGGTAIAVPISHAEVDFLKPMRCGDRLDIHVMPQATADSEFEIQFHIFAADVSLKPLSTALTRHVCIDGTTRQRQSLPDFLREWLHRWNPDQE